MKKAALFLILLISLGTFDTVIAAMTPPTLKGLQNSAKQVLRSFEQIQTFNTLEFEIESHPKQCYDRFFANEEDGPTQIEFDYQILNNPSAKKSALVVYWCNKQIKSVFSQDSGKRLVIGADAKKGGCRLKFCTAGQASQTPHQILIKNVAIYENRCNYVQGPNLIVNGDFERNNCNQIKCLWSNGRGFQQSDVVGWTPSPSIQIRRGKYYNEILGQSWVLKLDANSNSCIKQTVELKPGKALLTFDWAARMKSDDQGNHFQVNLNNQPLFSFIPTNRDLHNEKIKLDFASLPDNSVFEFCAKGKNEGSGVAVDNIKLVQKQCGTKQRTQVST